ncbi:peptidase S41 family protein [Lasiosphaeris hirsuta]|uniref:Peptidase S41 family protein n=1 Tax=Lasiosphaeris hirsuta TaxID=260670 RepID=A0AA40DWU4_9PEZI|nr:peptidase S41 family protein [Lasiosphaeris hirsuta]
MGLSRRRFAALLAVHLLGFLGVDAAPAPQVTDAAVPAVINPSACASVASLTDSLLAVSPLATPTVPATLAYECLQSVPNKVEPAQKLIKSVKAFVQWQSTLAFLKDPPESYMLAPVDLEGGLSNISDIAGRGGFASEFDFGIAIVYLLQSAHDGHFSFRPDVFKGFGFRNKLAADIVTVSIDGIQVPKLYHFADLNSTRNGTAAGAMPRAIVKINGEDAATVIERRNLVFSGYQDPDSQWNAVMQSYAFPAASTFVAASLDYQGPNTTITYDNGEVKTEANFAIIRAGANFTGVNSGEDYYNRFCNPEAAAATLAAAAEKNATETPTTLAAAEPTIKGYPFPVVRDAGANTTAGYFLNGTGYDDVAVLAVTGFSPAGDLGSTEYLIDFQRTLEEFLAKSKAAGKKKLVIDVSANGGGYIIAGYELFAQLFPDQDMFRADNLRESESLRAMAEISSQFLDEIISFDADSLESLDTADEQAAARARALGALQQSSIIGNIVPGGVFAPDGTNLTSVDAILDPVVLKGDRFTAYQFTPLNDTNPVFNLSGTGSRSDLPPAVFLPEDVVILTDGTCGSTCTLFSYLMILQLDVKTVAVGGRPRTGQMQSIAGVEGAQVFYLADISSAASAVLTLSPDANVTDSELNILDEGYALTRAANPASAGAVNGKNAFSRHDSQTPLQFLYQAANCRFFYTQQMLFSPVDVWKRAVDSTWIAPQRFCVEGSIVNVSMSGELTDAKFFLNSKIQTAGASVGNAGGSMAVLVGAVVMVLMAWA